MDHIATAIGKQLHSHTCDNINEISGRIDIFVQNNVSHITTAGAQNDTNIGKDKTTTTTKNARDICIDVPWDALFYKL